MVMFVYRIQELFLKLLKHFFLFMQFKLQLSNRLLLNCTAGERETDQCQNLQTCQDVYICFPAMQLYSKGNDTTALKTGQ